MARRATIHTIAIRQSPDFKSGQFDTFSGRDLRLVFDLYDQYFFSRQLRHLLDGSGSNISFDVSTRMTSAGASIRKVPARAPDVAPAYRITASAPVLFASFNGTRATFEVNGVSCRDRLEALQVLMEHEIVHLCEFILWGTSSHAKRFKEMAHGVFGHTDFRHMLITARQQAETRFGVRVGDLVTFVFDGRRVSGQVTRITKRATVLVPNTRPASRSSWPHKFYVPLPALTKLNQRAHDEDADAMAQ